MNEIVATENFSQTLQDGRFKTALHAFLAEYRNEHQGGIIMPPALPSLEVPRVGSGDILPGNGDPSMEVGPNHPLFGGPRDGVSGPVPGARFDPFGPIAGGLPSRGRIAPPRPAGGMFSGPNPDHLRMPTEGDGPNASNTFNDNMFT